MTADRERFLRLFAALRGVFYASGFVLLWSWIAVTVRRLDSRLSFPLPSALRPLGFALAVLGALLAASCILVFATRGRGTPAPFDAPRTFVASGPYRFVRNPMYLGAAGVLAGMGLLLRSPAVLLVAVGFLVIAHAFVLFYEEPTLRHRFGESYVEYSNAVGRWLPFLPRARSRRR